MSAQDLIARIKAAAEVAPLTRPAPEAPRGHAPRRPATDFVAFEYTDAHGTRGALRVLDTRPRLLALAQEVQRNAAAFDGKARRKPAARTVPTANPLTTARALLKTGARIEALAALEGRGGAVFFGNAPVPALHQVVQRVEHEGRRWVITRGADDGHIYIIHEASGLAAPNRDKGAPRTVADAVARLELIHRDEFEQGYRLRMIRAIEEAAEYDQRAARAAFEACDGLSGDAAKSAAFRAYHEARAIAAQHETTQEHEAADPASVESGASAPAPAVESAAPAEIAQEAAPAPMESEAATPPGPATLYAPGRPVTSLVRMAREAAAQLAREIRAAGDFTDGGILRHRDGQRWAFVLPDVGGCGRWRIQRFDARGFSGHELHADMAQCVRLAVGEGFTTRDDGALDRLATTAAFQRGNFAADLIRRINARELDHAAADALLAEYDAAQAPPPAAETAPGPAPVESAPPAAQPPAPAADRAAVDALIGRAIAWLAHVWGIAAPPTVADYRAGRCATRYMHAGAVPGCGYRTWADDIAECVATLQRNDGADLASRVARERTSASAPPARRVRVRHAAPAWPRRARLAQQLVRCARIRARCGTAGMRAARGLRPVALGAQAPPASASRPPFTPSRELRPPRAAAAGDRTMPDSTPYAVFRHDGQAVTLPTVADFWQAEVSAEACGCGACLNCRAVAHVRATRRDAAITACGDDPTPEQRAAWCAQMHAALHGTGYGCEFDPIGDDALFMDPDGDLIGPEDMPPHVRAIFDRVARAQGNA
ncbi:hypothetical protein [Azohydromonas aeria]|uniref:hypothetical protein n=1 Tax=Azohydromonas aeria TaxID=2590212 RepID=UPI0018E03B87|nr:hypothetical protein [Azohydromonas aeria]